MFNSLLIVGFWLESFDWNVFDGLWQIKNGSHDLIYVIEGNSTFNVVITYQLMQAAFPLGNNF